MLQQVTPICKVWNNTLYATSGYTNKACWQAVHTWHMTLWMLTNITYKPPPSLADFFFFFSLNKLNYQTRNVFLTNLKGQHNVYCFTLFRCGGPCHLSSFKTTKAMGCYYPQDNLFYSLMEKMIFLSLCHFFIYIVNFEMWIVNLPFKMW